MHAHHLAKEEPGLELPAVMGAKPQDLRQPALERCSGLDDARHADRGSALG
jgi:hypothetical protein